MKSESGQAAIEYILLLVITVALIIGLTVNLFKPFQEYLSSYMGDYTKCLLQTGELPSLGDDGAKGNLSAEGCDKHFEMGTLANGRPPIGGSAGGSTGNGSTGTNANSGNGSSSRNSRGGGENGGREGESSAAGSASRGAGNNRIFNPRSGTQSGESSGEDGKKTEIALDGGSGSGFFASNSVEVSRRRTKSVVISGSQFSEEEKKKIDKKLADGRRSVASDLPGTPPKKTTIKPVIKSENIETEDGEFTIGNFMRMLFIIAIILAIVIFVGGQLLQMSKSGDN